MDDSLLDRLAAEGARAPVGRRRDVRAAGFSALAALLLVLLWLGPRDDIAPAGTTWIFWHKIAFPLFLAWLAWCALRRSAHPGADIRGRVLMLVACLLCYWFMALVYVAADAQDWRDQLFGTSWQECPLWVAAISLPMLMPALSWLRGQGPVQPRWSGALAGLTCGLVAAALYSLHCREPGLLFVGVWYVAGALIPAALGALFGPRLLAW